MTSVKRFIAGATCPDCGKTDKIYVIKSEKGVSRHCSSCGFEEGRPEAAAPGVTGEWIPVRLPDS